MINMNGSKKKYSKVTLQKAILKIEKKDTVCVPSSMMTREEFLGLSSESFDEEIPTYRERKEESALHKAGYSVGQDSTLSTHQRQDLLANLIKTGQFKKSYIVHHLEYLIRINGKSEHNDIALKRWKNDLDFVRTL